MKAILKYTAIIIVLYIYIHNPILSITGFGAIKFLYILPIFIGISGLKANLKSLKGFIALFIIIFLYTLLRTLLGGDYIFIYATIIDFIELIILPLTIISLLKSTHITIASAIVYLGLVSCLFTLSSLFIPEIKNTFTNLMVENKYLEIATYRGFGFAEGLTSNYGNSLAIITSIGLANIKNHKWFLAMIPLLGISIIVNARTPFLIYIFSILVIALYNKKSIIILLTISLTTFIVFKLIPDFSDDYTYTFIQEFFLEIGDIIFNTSNANSSTVDVLFNDMLVLPKNGLEWIFGKGIDIFRYSDIGWLRQMGYGGLIYLTLILLIAYRVSLMIPDKYLLIVFIFTLILANTKGAYLLNSSGMRLWFLYSLYYYQRYKSTAI